MPNTATMTKPAPAAPAVAPLHPNLRIPNVITIASGKGGVGKTWVAVTLVHTLAKKGYKSLLFDGDLGLANVDIQLGLLPKHDLGSVLAGTVSMADAVARYTDGGFDILAGKSGSGALALLSGDRLNMVRDGLAALARRYDRVVVDLGAGIETHVRTLAATAGIVLVVATDEPTSLTDAYAFIKVTAMQHPGTDIRIVINQADNAREGRRTYETLRKACEQFLSISPPLAGVIRTDSKVKDSIRAQVPLLIRYPTCNAAADVEAIASSLLVR